MTKEELSTYQAQWLRLKGILREVKMMRLGGSSDTLYAEDMRKIEESLEATLKELKQRIEGAI
jgi:hypothetical protein